MPDFYTGRSLSKNIPGFFFHTLVRSVSTRVCKTIGIRAMRNPPLNELGENIELYQLEGQAAQDTPSKWKVSYSSSKQMPSHASGLGSTKDTRTSTVGRAHGKKT